MSEDSEEQDDHYEIVGGLRVAKPRLAVFPTVIVSILTHELGVHARQGNLGRVAAFMLFKITPTFDLQRRPDVAFVSYDRWPRARKLDSEEGWDVVPDLAIEVVNPGNSADESVRKVREYFHASARRVWLVYPGERQVYDYKSPKSVRILDIGDAIDGADILPGFRLSLAELFEDGEV